MQFKYLYCYPTLYCTVIAHQIKNQKTNIVSTHRSVHPSNLQYLCPPALICHALFPVHRLEANWLGLGNSIISRLFFSMGSSQILALRLDPGSRVGGEKNVSLFQAGKKMSSIDTISQILCICCQKIWLNNLILLSTLQKKNLIGMIVLALIFDQTKYEQFSIVYFFIVLLTE